MNSDSMIRGQGETNRKQLPTALYMRLSREDGDKTESFSIRNQRLLLTEFLRSNDDLVLYDTYVDDGYTGTNFNRPEFLRMIHDIERKKIQCVVVKDLSRLGRNMPKVSGYINEYFPDKRVRFIAVNDRIDRQYYDVDASDDMMIDLKNMFNGFYPKDISKKVRSTFRMKQANGQFIGAFASYGYAKSEYDHNQLVIDEYAAAMVQRIFHMYIRGMGQNTIAKTLNDEGIPCPSEYKKQCGLHYRNSNRLDTTSYWTYTTIRKILQNEIYIGHMVQHKSLRQLCKKNAVSLPREQWMVVENTHEAIVDRDTWDKVQRLLKQNTRQTGFTHPVHNFAGFLRCGNCGRAMVKINRKDPVFHCGSYNRYGKGICSMHKITEQELEDIVLRDFNLLLRSVSNTRRFLEEEQLKFKCRTLASPIGPSQYQAERIRLEKKIERAYEDYADDVITKEDYLKYKRKYEQQIAAIQFKRDAGSQEMSPSSVTSNPWIEKLLRHGQFDHLDRETVVEMLSMIYVYENNTIKIIYNFSDEMDTLLSDCSSDSNLAFSEPE